MPGSTLLEGKRGHAGRQTGKRVKKKTELGVYNFFRPCKKTGVCAWDRGS